jgi:splicing factor 3B subunit 3
MDLGLNHVIRKNIIPVDRTAGSLIAVPGDDGPGGILVICEDFLLYHRVGHEERKCFYPVRRDTKTSMSPKDQKLFITSSATFCLGVFFFLIQSEYGDLFKVTLDCTE